jgi:plastocyanin
MKWLKLTSLLAAFTLAACGGGGDTGSTTTTETPAQQATPAKAATATIKGLVKYTGAAPAKNRIKMGADPFCETQHTEPVYDESTVVGADGSLENVFVYVKAGLEGQTFETPSEPVIFDQNTCMYNPHVFGIQANQELKILNSDATLHNVHATPKNSAEFNVGMPTKGMEITKKFKNPEIMVHIKCEVHPWMSAYAGVLDHPFFAVAGTGGAFQLPVLPAGTYTIEAWHEKLGAQTQEVVVGDGETKEITFTFQAGA